MRFTVSAVAVLSVAAMASAQVTVQVGAEENTPGGIFQFLPPNITASNGTVVTFTWSGSPGNHTVAQTTLDNPCQPMQGGFDSGYIFVPANLTSGFPTWNLTITNDQQPIYFYCAQLAPEPHCSAGMVGTINAPAGSFEAYQQAAMATAPNLPGNPSPNLVGLGASASAPPGPFSGSVTGFGVPTGSAASAASSSGSSSASSGASSVSGTTTTTSTSAAATTTTASAASLNAVSGLTVFIASLLGITLL